MNGILVSQTELTVDGNGNITNEIVQQVLSGGGTNVQETYLNTFDANNNLISESLNGSATNNTYNSTQQVTSNGSNNYSFDANGNRNSVGFTVGTNNEITSDGTWNYSYDVNGNMIQKVNISTGIVWQYGYNLNNELISATELTSINGTIMQSSVYTYDVFGNLLKESTSVYSNGMLVSTSTQSHAYVINDISTTRNATTNTEWATLDNNGNVVLRYLSMNAGSTLLAETSFATGGQDIGAGIVSYLVQDRIGDIRQILDANGNLLDSINYDAFGNITTQTNSIYQPNYLFGGLFFDTATGLYLAHWRSYDSSTGQWLQQDPMGFSAGDANLRRYVGNNGLNRVDRNGEAVKNKLVIGSVGGGLSSVLYLTSQVPIVRITQTEKPIFGKQLGMVWSVNYKLVQKNNKGKFLPLDKANSLGGFIIQHVRRVLSEERKITNAQGKFVRNDPKREVEDYWESFWVPRNENSPRLLKPGNDPLPGGGSIPVIESALPNSFNKVKTKKANDWFITPLRKEIEINIANGNVSTLITYKILFSGEVYYFENLPFSKTIKTNAMDWPIGFKLDGSEGGDPLSGSGRSLPSNQLRKGRSLYPEQQVNLWRNNYFSSGPFKHSIEVDFKAPKFVPRIIKKSP